MPAVDGKTGQRREAEGLRLRVPEEPDEDLLMHEESVLAGLVELSGVEIL
ncbi:hypothetical protein [Micromonospora sp. NPDC004551]